MAKNSSNSNEREIEIAKLAYIGAAIAAVADAIALIGDGIAAYAAKLTLDELLNPQEETDGTDSSGISTVPIDITPSSRRSASTKSNTNRNNTTKDKKQTRAKPDVTEDFPDLKEQIDHYINQLIEIRDSLIK